MPSFNRQHSSRSTVIRRTQSNSSPDPSFIFIRNHTAALDRCSSVSDGDALFWNLAACPDPDPQRTTCLHEDSNNPPSSAKAKEFDQEEVGGETLDPSKHSFSHAVKGEQLVLNFSALLEFESKIGSFFVSECKNRRFRSESHSFPKRKPRDHRPTSLDFNGHNADVSIISPRFLMSSLNTMKSPGTPNYRYPKGWSSERVLPSSISSRRYMPFNNGRPIPSKWEDAEKWIFSPVGSENAGRSSVPPPHHRRPKSKSGPLGPPAYFASSGPASPLNNGRVGGGFGGGSPFLGEVFVGDKGVFGGGGGGGGGGVSGGRSSSANAEPYILRSASMHGWSDTMVESSSSLPSSQGTVQDEKVDSSRGNSRLSSAILRKDVATQMSPDESTQSSPKERHPFSQSPLAHPIEKLESHFSKLEVRDVQVDDRVTVTRWSKKQVARGFDRRSVNIIEWKKKPVEAKADPSSVSVVTETKKCISKYKREEAKITAWENLQKAKAEAAVRKLEMKLEKKRSSSMDKILNKLKSAQRKAQEMRSAVATVQSQQVAKTTPRRSSYFRRTGQTSSLSGCFTCPAF